MKSTTPSQATVRPAKERKTPTKAAAKQAQRQATKASHGQVTLGFNLGGRKHTYCALDAGGNVLKQDKVNNDRQAMAVLIEAYLGAPVVTEALMSGDPAIEFERRWSNDPWSAEP